MLESLPIYQNKKSIQRDAYNFVMRHIDREEINNVADVFAGTASLSIPFFRHASQVRLNDKYTFLFYYLAFYTKYLSNDLFIEMEYELEKIKDIELYKGFIYNQYTSSLKKSFFGENDAIKIDSVHKYLNENKVLINKDIFNYIYGNFIYSVYKASNIKNGYFYMKSKDEKPEDDVFKLSGSRPNEYFKNKKVEITNYDYKDFIKYYSGDLLIVDPPIKRKLLNMYYPLEFLAKNPCEGIEALNYEDEFSYLGPKYINALQLLISRSSYKYIFLYLDKSVYKSFPKMFFKIFIHHELELDNGYFVLLEKF